MVFYSSENLSIPEHDVGEAYVYVLEIERDDGETYYYVGSTSSSPSRRLKQHTSQNACRKMPVNRDGIEVLGDTSEQAFTIVGVERVVPVNSDSRDRLLEVERETAYQVAIDHQTTNISGVQP